MNAPKKIWYSFEYEKRIIAGANEEDSPYIRADLVDGLVEALIDCQEALRRANANGEIAVIDAALKALETNNE